MKDPHPMRLNTKDDPNRTAKLSVVEKAWGVDPSNVIRRLVDAYLKFVDEHDGHPPSFPVVLVPEEEFALLQEKAAEYKAKKKTP